jgi:hypothetical protein
MIVLDFGCIIYDGWWFEYIYLVSPTFDSDVVPSCIFL